MPIKISRLSSGLIAVVIMLLTTAGTCMAVEPVFDVLIRGGMVIDGTGAPPQRVDVGIRGAHITTLGTLNEAQAKQVIDATGLAVAPGFINMLSWATESLLQDGSAESDIRQGVTLEVMGEGWSMGPLNNVMKQELLQSQGDIKFDIPWTTLGEYLEHLVGRGVAPNVASFVGATTIRIHVLGRADRQANSEELEQMRALVRQAMEAGALGIGSSLIYAPAFYADTRELIELCKVAAAYDGLYITHLRSEGNRFLEAVDEMLQIAREANIAAEIYHLKAAGKQNWHKLDQAIQKVEQAREEGLRISANMYTYTAGATGLDAAMPPWVQEGGFDRWRDRLRDESIRQRVAREMKTPTNDWENLLLMAGSPDKVLLVGFKNPDLKHLTGKTLSQVAKQRNKSVEETAMDLVVEDGSRVGAVYFLMDEANVQRKITLPWVSFGSDSAAVSPRGVFLQSNPHPRGYGCFARLLGNYVRDKKTIPLETAIHKLTGLPARHLGIRRRGQLQPGYFADVVIFDPQSIQDHATYAEPHQFATGVRDVLVNGKLVLHNGSITKHRPGRIVHGPGKWRRRGARPPIQVTADALRVHQDGFVFDGHNDLPWAMRTKGDSSFTKLDIAQSQSRLHTDIPRLNSGNVGAQFWSVYVPAGTARQGTALLQTLEQIELVKEMVQHYPNVFQLAHSTEDIKRIRKTGKIASLIGVEGGHAIEDSLQNLRRLYQLGARYMTLTHSDTLTWADSATGKVQHNGLTPFGEAVVREMNLLGMLVDLSHVSPDTMHDALRITQAPVIFSHSSARALADHPRNVPDDVLRKVADNRGVVMVNFYNGFIHPEVGPRRQREEAFRTAFKKKSSDPAALQTALRQWRRQHPLPVGDAHQVVDHIEHIARVAGIEHVGLGADYDGVSVVPRQLPDVSAYPVITQELLNRGYTRSEIHQILSGNVMRVFRETEQVSQELQRKANR